MTLLRVHSYSAWSKVLHLGHPILFVLLFLCGCSFGEVYEIDWTSQEDVQYWPDASWELVEDELGLPQVDSLHTCRWLGHDFDDSKLDFTTSVEVRLQERGAVVEGGWLGFIFGLPEEGNESATGLAVGITASGRTFVGKTDEYNAITLPDAFRLEVRGMEARDNKFYLFVEVFRLSGRMIGQRIAPVDPSWLAGFLALTASSQLPPSVVPWESKPDHLPEIGFVSPDTDWGASFSSWTVHGDRFEAAAETQ
ncbi:MAG: hypothetical protein AAGF87_09965 [Bacteroidota bacterium]